MKMPIAVLLPDIRSAHNVGSIFRTCDAAGVSRVFLSGHTPLPVDRFGRIQKDIAKTALGAEKNVPWKYERSALRTISRLKKDGWNIVAVEQDDKSKDYRKFKLKEPTLFIFGNEVNGISKSILKKCDAVVEIPMRGTMVRQAHHPRHVGGGKESLNVSVVAGIILFSIR
jgi:tRNA G18 (ribose-2'-O)-methylase SpoU